ncbi:hypothetical protein M9H77_08059 [Catharanthus roseus]|uniref:Uncharacterized protein n=1 Tax=Catharanthus roseus TaxID=4058 RepID=A0ACC0BWW8_CATRO|nr:hypothetical protein M9H77_08059 [Catharanthus roseus]
MITIEETIKEGLKFKNEGLEDDGNPPKLYMVQCLNLEQAMELVGRRRNKEKKEYSTCIQEVLRLVGGCLRMESIQALLKAKNLSFLITCGGISTLRTVLIPIHEVQFDGGLVPSHYSGISYNVLEPSERLYM